MTLQTLTCMYPPPHMTLQTRSCSLSLALVLYPSLSLRESEREGKQAACERERESIQTAFTRACKKERPMKVKSTPTVRAKRTLLSLPLVSTECIEACTRACDVTPCVSALVHNFVYRGVRVRACMPGACGCSGALACVRM